MTFQLQDDFDLFWKLWPRKEGSKPQLRKKWAKLSKAIKVKIMEDIQTRYEGIQKCYIPHPSTYLNQQRWENDPIPREEEKTAHISSDDFIREELAKKPQPKPLRSKEESEDGINNLQRIMECVK